MQAGKHVFPGKKTFYFLSLSFLYRKEEKGGGGVVVKLAGGGRGGARQLSRREENWVFFLVASLPTSFVLSFLGNVSVVKKKKVASPSAVSGASFPVMFYSWITPEWNGRSKTLFRPYPSSSFFFVVPFSGDTPLSLTPSNQTPLVSVVCPKN